MPTMLFILGLLTGMFIGIAGAQQYPQPWQPPNIEQQMDDFMNRRNILGGRNPVTGQPMAPPQNPC